MTDTSLVASNGGGQVAQWEDQRSLAQRINRMLEVQRNVMKPDVDYGKIPGCDKPTLLKPGAELLCMTFRVGDRMAPGYPMREIDYQGNITFTVVMEFYDQVSGTVIGQGMGIASTAEEKYAWRKIVHENEWNDTPEDRRSLKYYKDGGTQKRIHTNPKDVENTVAKMAKKRAKVDGCLNVLAASRVFAQDLEDLPEGIDGDEPRKQSTKPQVTMPTPRQQAPAAAGQQSDNVISEAQAKRLYVVCKKAEVNPEHVKNWLKTKMSIDGFSGIPKSHYDAICKRVENKPEEFKAYEQGKQPETAAPTNEDFVQFATAIAKDAGLTVEGMNQMLFDQFGIGDIVDVPDEKASAVIDYLTSLKESASA